mmetsp:Transcript_16970/g.48212  ORF Transcript_16970/g.48212 Transcript_16970/m.48212 type:complete len:546 (+) Transcript_16970:402-2039(+)
MIAELVLLLVLWVIAAAYGVWQAKLGMAVPPPTHGDPRKAGSGLAQVSEQEMVQNSKGKTSAAGTKKGSRLPPPTEPVTGIAAGSDALQRRTTPDLSARRQTGRSSNTSFTEGSFLSRASRPASHVSRLASEIGLAKDGSNTFMGSVVNIITGGLGAGILCLPWAAAGASLSASIVIILVVLVVNAWTIDILVKAAEQRGVFDIGALLGELPGRLSASMEWMCNIVIWGTLFLCLISYYIVIADCSLKAFGGIPAFSDSVRDNHDAWRTGVLIVAAAILVPICFLDQDKLAYTSTMSVVVNCFVICIITFDMFDQISLGPGRGVWTGTPICVFGLGYGSIAMFATLMQCVILQMCVLPMYLELKDHSPRKFKHVVNSSFAGLFLLFSGFAFAGVMAFGVTTVSENVLTNLGASIPALVSQAGMVLCIMSVYPIMFMPMVAPLKTSKYKSLAVPVTIMIVALSCLAAFPLRNLGEISIICGSLSVACFVGIIPALIGYYIVQKSAVAMTLLGLSMTVMGLLGLIYRDNIYEGDVCFVEAWALASDM